MKHKTVQDLINKSVKIVIDEIEDELENCHEDYKNVYCLNKEDWQALKKRILEDETPDSTKPGN